MTVNSFINPLDKIKVMRAVKRKAPQVTIGGKLFNIDYDRFADLDEPEIMISPANSDFVPLARIKIARIQNTEVWLSGEGEVVNNERSEV